LIFDKRKVGNNTIDYQSIVPTLVLGLIYYKYWNIKPTLVVGSMSSSFQHWNMRCGAGRVQCGVRTRFPNTAQNANNDFSSIVSSGLYL